MYSFYLVIWTWSVGWNGGKGGSSEEREMIVRKKKKNKKMGKKKKYNKIYEGSYGFALNTISSRTEMRFLKFFLFYFIFFCLSKRSISRCYSDCARLNIFNNKILMPRRKRKKEFRIIFCTYFPDNFYSKYS